MTGRAWLGSGERGGEWGGGGEEPSPHSLPHLAVGMGDVPWEVKEYRRSLLSHLVYPGTAQLASVAGGRSVATTRSLAATMLLAGNLYAAAGTVAHVATYPGDRCLDTVAAHRRLAREMAERQEADAAALDDAGEEDASSSSEPEPEPEPPGDAADAADGSGRRRDGPRALLQHGGTAAGVVERRAAVAASRDAARLDAASAARASPRTESSPPLDEGAAGSGSTPTASRQRRLNLNETEMASATSTTTSATTAAGPLAPQRSAQGDQDDPIEID